MPTELDPQAGDSESSLDCVFSVRSRFYSLSTRLPFLLHHNLPLNVYAPPARRGRQREAEPTLATC